MKQLSKIKRSILQSASRFPYVTNRTYSNEKQSLCNDGYLTSYSKLIDGESCIISGCYMITDKGREALND
jgi:hypothetical protein